MKFPLSLDVFDLCSEELQKKLMPVRAKFKEIEDKKVEEAAVRQPLSQNTKHLLGSPYLLLCTESVSQSVDPSVSQSVSQSVCLSVLSVDHP